MTLKKFPNTWKNTPIKRWKQLREFAYQVGLGKNKDLQKVSFQQNAKGEFEGATKHFANNKTVHVDSKHFENLRKQYKNNPDQLKSFEAFEKTFNKVKNCWSGAHSGPKEASKKDGVSQNMEANYLQSQVNGQKGPPKVPPESAHLRAVNASENRNVDLAEKSANLEKLASERNDAKKELASLLIKYTKKDEQSINEILMDKSENSASKLLITTFASVDLEGMRKLEVAWNKFRVLDEKWSKEASEDAR